MTRNSIQTVPGSFAAAPFVSSLPASLENMNRSPL
jgi:hypothetical protein